MQLTVDRNFSVKVIGHTKHQITRCFFANKFVDLIFTVNVSVISVSIILQSISLLQD